MIWFFLISVFNLDQNEEFIPQIGNCERNYFNISEKNILSNDLRECCIEHDICYQTCDSDRNECEKNFELCLQINCESSQSVEQIEICKTSLNRIQSNNSNDKQCEIFVNAQLEACVCIDKK